MTWVSRQSEVIDDLRHLINQHQNFLQAHEDKEIPKPDNWGAYEIFPEMIEIMHFKTSRIHERTLYTKKDEENWNSVVLQP